MSIYDPSVPQEARTWALVSHLSAPVGYLLGIFSWVGPLVVYLVRKDRDRFAAFHALQELYFQIAWILFFAVAWTLAFVGAIATLGLGFIVIVPVMGVLHFVPIVWSVVAALKAQQGEWYDYPVVGAWVRR